MRGSSFKRVWYVGLTATLIFVAGNVADKASVESKAQLNRSQMNSSNIQLLDIMETALCGSINTKDNLVFAGFGALLSILDVSDPGNPSKIANFEITKSIEGIDIASDHAYLIDYNGTIWVLDISNPSVPALDTTLAGISYGTGRNITWHEDYLYAARSEHGLFIYDATDPARPQPVGLFSAVNTAADVAVQGDYAYLADFSSGLKIINVADKTNPTLTGSYDRTQWIALSVKVAGNYAYVTSVFYDTGLWIIDITDPANPVDVGFCYVDFFPSDVVVEGDYAYVTSAGTDQELAVIDISDPANPVRTGGEPLAAGYQVALAGSLACVAASARGVSVVNVSNPSNPAEVGQFATLRYIEDIETTGDYLILVRTQGLTMMEIDRWDRQYELDRQFYYEESFAVEVQGTYAYLANCDSWYQNYQGLSIVDIQDPTHPVEIGFLGGYCIYRLAVEEDYLYFVDGSIFIVVDVSDPSNPAVTGSFPLHWARGLDAQGSLVFVAADDAGLRIVDATLPDAPFETGSYVSNWIANDVAVSGSHVCLAGGVPDSDFGLLIVDVSDPTNPAVIDSVNTSGNTRAVSISGHYVYLTGDGLTVVDVTDPWNPVTAGVYGAGDFTGRTEMTSSYLFVNSRTESGLYIFQTDLVSGSNVAGNPQNRLEQNYPNPFNPTTTIRYSIAEAGQVSLRVYNVAGQLVRTLVNTVQSPGQVRPVRWNGLNSTGQSVSSGVYFYRLTADGYTRTRKMVVIK